MAESDFELLTMLVALDGRVSLSKASDLLRLSRDGIEEDGETYYPDEDEDGHEVPNFENDTARRFIELATRFEPAEVAAFIYLNDCDELADGLHELTEAEIAARIEETYQWALGFVH